MSTKGEATRKLIIEKALELFLSIGYDKVRFQDIAKEAGLTQPALYNYFEDKTDILASCSLFSARSLAQYLGKNLDFFDSPEKQLEEYIVKSMHWFNKNRPETNSLLCGYYFSKTTNKIDEVRKVIEGNGRKKIELLLQQGNMTGAWSVEDISTDARLIHSLLVGEVHKQFHTNKKRSIIGKSINDIIKRVIHGASKKSDGSPNP